MENSLVYDEAIIEEPEAFERFRDAVKSVVSGSRVTKRGPLRQSFEVDA
jgi:hypothetical protein